MDFEKVSMSARTIYLPYMSLRLLQTFASENRMRAVRKFVHFSPRRGAHYNLYIIIAAYVLAGARRHGVCV